MKWCLFILACLVVLLFIGMVSLSETAHSEHSIHQLCPQKVAKRPGVWLT